MALSLDIQLYTNAACTNLFLEDMTGAYTATNLGGYGSPNPPANSVTSVTVTVDYTLLEISNVFEFTVSSGTITAATMTLDGGTPVNILSLLTSTAWPFTDTNPLNLTTTDWSDTLPSFDDMVYTVTYQVEGDSGGAFDVSTVESALVKCSVCCCINKKTLKIDINDTTKLVNSLIPVAYLKTASYAKADGLTDKANSYLQRAQAICDNSDCGCGC